MNFWLLGSLGKRSSQELPAPESRTLLLTEPQSMGDHDRLNPLRMTYGLVPEDPSKYGIVSIKPSRMPRHQVEWDIHMEKLVKDSGLLESEKGRQATEKMDTSGEKFQDTMGKVDQEIALLEKQQSENPLDAGIDNRLQNLYKLKALGRVLADKVTTLPQAIHYE